MDQRGDQRLHSSSHKAKVTVLRLGYMVKPLDRHDKTPGGQQDEIHSGRIRSSVVSAPSTLCIVRGLAGESTAWLGAAIRRVILGESQAFRCGRVRSSMAGENGSEHKGDIPALGYCWAFPWSAHGDQQACVDVML